ncbi:tyrosine-type recombinase/integrase [Comamonas suwonensis]|jgi:integrase|uniref:Integrase family protein n=1 Tax=Comamonas suwonensis TaxID=2606214 RepID=A0A843BAM3_9BURK|nr:integrase family protein [Comamonas suwonensis]MBI1625914.1 integrase family protein [Comamonas suwonensis]
MTDKTPTRLAFNKTNLDAIPFAPQGKQVTYYDTNKTNLALRVGATSKTFIVYTRPKGSTAPVRITLGKYGAVAIKQAADLAAKELAKIADGRNPLEEKQQAKAEQEQAKATEKETFKWMMDTYKDEQIIAHKGGSQSTLDNIATALDYFGDKTVMTLKKNEDGTWSNDVEVHLSSWHDRPLRSITRQDVLDRFAVFDKARPARNQKVLAPIARTHQLSFKFASSAYNFIIARNELDTKEDFRNPFDAMSAHKKWKKTKARTRFVDFNRDEFGKWWKAVEEYDFAKSLVSDYLLFSLLQASRSIDSAPLTWSQVDLELNRINYGNTKNGEDYFYPMTKRIRQIIERRKELNKDGGLYVFDYDESKTGHVPQDCQYHFKVIAAKSGKLISHHDLRRTWATAAYSLDMDGRMIDYLLKHTINDVNSHYFMRNEQKILKALQTVEDFFEGKAVKSLKDETEEYQREEVE